MAVELRCPKTILLPVDFSEASGASARCAELVAKRFHASVVLLHVLEPVANPFELLGGGFAPYSRMDAARSELSGIGRQEFFTVAPDVRVVEGEPAEQIAAVAHELEADLLVMPTRGKGAFRRFLLGSVTAKILNDVSVPVLTTAHESDNEQSCKFGVNSVLCALALDDRAPFVCRAAAMIASEYEASLTLVHILEDGESGIAHDQLRAIASENGASSANLIVDKGRPDAVVVQIARTTRADLVVIGRSSPGPLGRLRAQSYGIIRESPAPVLSV